MCTHLDVFYDGTSKVPSEEQASGWEEAPSANCLSLVVYKKTSEHSRRRVLGAGDMLVLHLWDQLTISWKLSDEKVSCPLLREPAENRDPVVPGPSLSSSLQWA